MKKIFIVFSAISMSAFLSACSSYGHNTTQTDANSTAMPHCQSWNTDHKEHMRMMTQYYFDQMDANGDGYVTRKEFLSYQNKIFREADTNHDGQLTLEEVMAQEMRERNKMKQSMMNHHGDMQQDNIHDGDNSQDMSGYHQRDTNSTNDADQGNRY